MKNALVNQYFENEALFAASGGGGGDPSFGQDRDFDPDPMEDVIIDGFAPPKRMPVPGMTGPR